MPYAANETAALMVDLKIRLGRLTETARQEGHAAALAEVSSLVGAAAALKRGPGRPPKSAAPVAPAKTKRDGRRSSWSGLSPAKRLARVNAIRKGKGLPPRSE